MVVTSMFYSYLTAVHMFIKYIKILDDKGQIWLNACRGFDFVACVSSVFGHISYRSDWELVKVDFRQSFPRQCTESDYDSWQLTDLQVTHTYTHAVYIPATGVCVCVLNWILVFPQGEKCIMGQERSFRKRKDTAFCIKGKSYTSAVSSQPCQCTERDFTWWEHTHLPLCYI